MIGIYKIINIINNKIYVGSTINIRHRWKCHIKTLNSNRNKCKLLQRAWNKYGGDAFKFEILEELVFPPNYPKELIKIYILQREQFYLDTLLYASENNNLFNELGYNICRVAGSQLGFKHSEKSKLQMSLFQKGKLITEEARKKISEANIKRFKDPLERAKCAPSKEMRQLLSLMNKGKKMSEEVKNKISNSNKGKIQSKQSREKKAKAQAGEKGNSAKLTWKQVKVIKRALRWGICYLEIAKRFGVSRMAISDIKFGRTWKDEYQPI